MMDAIQRAVPVPQAEVIMHGASGRQILGQRAPLAAGAQNVHHAVDHLADSDAPFAAAGLARRDQRLDMRPFRIGQVARITQFVAVVARARCRQSTWGTSRVNSPPQRITADSALQEGPPDNRFIRLIKSRTDTKHVPRYLAQYEYRFNRRYRLEDMIPRLAWVALRTRPCLTGCSNQLSLVRNQDAL